MTKGAPIPRPSLRRARGLIGEIARRHGISPAAIVGRSRHVEVRAARLDAMRAVASTLPHLSSTQLGGLFCRDHTTILHALKHGNPRGVIPPPEGWEARAARIIIEVALERGTCAKDMRGRSYFPEHLSARAIAVARIAAEFPTATHRMIGALFDGRRRESIAALKARGRKLESCHAS